MHNIRILRILHGLHIFKLRNILATYPTTYLPNYLPTHPPTHPPTYLPTFLSTYLPIYLPIYLQLWPQVLENFALRAFCPSLPLCNVDLRWLKAVSLFFNTNSLRDRCYHTVSFVSMKIISNKCPFIAQQVLIIFIP